MITIKRIYDFFKRFRNNNLELLWARKWDDTKKNIEWIEGLPGISPVGYAVGYNYLYLMTRILDEMQPQSVLDIGLGISSTLFSQYFNYYRFKNGKHIIIEHDKQWIRFYSLKHNLSNFSKVVLLDCVKRNFDSCEYNVYKDFGVLLKDKKFSVISIDGPNAGDKPYKHSRRDVLEILPDALEESFVIVMDDYNRKGEKATIAEIEEVLKKNNIVYFKGIYPGVTDCCVLTSADNKFFCTM